MMTRAQLAAAILLAGAACAVPAGAETPKGPDVRAKDAFQLFDSMCVKTDGDKSRAVASLSKDSPVATRLSDKAVQGFQGKPGGIAWAITSPNESQMMLGYTASGICEVRVADADEEDMLAQYGVLKASLGGNGEAKDAPTRTEGTAKVTLHTYRFDKSGRKALVALTTSDKRVGAQQHMITFSFVK